MNSRTAFVEAAIQKIADHLDDWIRSHGDPLTLYRELIVDDLRDIDFRKLGVYWTPIQRKADSPYGRIDNTVGTRVVVRAVVPFSAVDVPGTRSALRRWGAGESEILLLPGQPVQVTGLFVGGKEIKKSVRGRS